LLSAKLTISRTAHGHLKRRAAKLVIRSKALPVLPASCATTNAPAKGDEALPAKRSIPMAKLAIAVVSVVNATSALAAPKPAPGRPCGAVTLASETSDRTAPATVRRPPRVPRREQYLHGEWRIGEW
jgi:hypothetical protein